MSDYTPTTEEVRRYWQYGADACPELLAAIFDRWLDSVKAEAWDEGADRVWNRDGFLPYSIRRQNPYRTKETNDDR